MLFDKVKDKLSKASPIRRNLLANLLGVGINLLNQVVLVPFYIIFWGNELYSDWIVISALITIFAISDVGINNVIQNRFAIKFTEGNYKECNDLLSSNFVILGLTYFVLLLLTLIYLTIFDISKNMGLHVLNSHDAGLIFILLLTNIFLSMYGRIQNAVYRATHHTDRVTYIDQFVFLAVVITTLIFIITRASLIWMCVSISIPHILITIYKHFDSRRYFKHQVSYVDVNWKLIRHLLTPSLTFMSFPIANAIVIQGFTLIVNRYFGANEVVLFNTSRTMCNFIKSLINTIQNAVWPEYSIAYGEKNYERMRTLHRKSIRTSVAIATLIGVVLMIMGPLIFKIWTHGRVPFDYLLMLGLITSLIIESLWISSSITIMATNTHTRLGLSFVTIAALSTLATPLLIVNRSLPMVTISLIFLQIVMSVIALRESLRLTNDKLSHVFRLK